MFPSSEEERWYHLPWCHPLISLVPRLQDATNFLFFLFSYFFGGGSLEADFLFAAALDVPELTL